MGKRTIKVHAADGRVTIPLRGWGQPYAVVPIQTIRGASYWGTSGVTISVEKGGTLDADLDEAGFAALLRVLVSEFEQRAQVADDVETVPFS